MSNVVAIHGATGSGKSTLVRAIKAHFGSSSFVIEECLDELMLIPSTKKPNREWFQKKTAIMASDNVTQFMMERLNPLSLFIVVMVSYWIFDSLWPIMTIILALFTSCRLLRWLNCHILSKLWLYNVSLFYDRQQKLNGYSWIWRDRTSLDVYSFCLLNRATAVPSDLPKIILDEANATSVAIILDRPRHLIEKHLKQRMKSPNASRSFAIATWLILYLDIPLTSSIDSLKFVERLYKYLGIPVIKISEIESQLEHNEITGDIEWNQHSMDVLQAIVNEAIKNCERSTLETIDEFLLPWRTLRDSYLYC